VIVSKISVNMAYFYSNYSNSISCFKWSNIKKKCGNCYWTQANAHVCLNSGDVNKWFFNIKGRPTQFTSQSESSTVQSLLSCCQTHETTWAFLQPKSKDWHRNFDLSWKTVCLMHFASVVTIDYSKNFTTILLPTIQHMAIFVVKSIHIHIHGQVMDLSIDDILVFEFQCYVRTSVMNYM